MTENQTIDIPLLRQGDQGAFELLYKKYFNALFFFAQQYLKEESEAENMVQESYLSFWLNRQSFQGSNEASAKAWLYNTLKNKCLNHLERELNRTKYMDAEKQKTQLDIGALNDLEISEITFNEINELLHKALKEMPPQCSKVFQLSRFKGLKNKEIANELNISVKAVEANMTRALKLLKVHLGDYMSLLFVLQLFR
jgi:RNA polymerase sigma-70 factor (ECF subfamily)